MKMTPLFFNTGLWILLLQPLHGQSAITFSTAVVNATCMKEETERIKGKDEKIEEEKNGEREDWGRDRVTEKMQEREDSFDYQMKLNWDLKFANQEATCGEHNFDC